EGGVGHGTYLRQRAEDWNSRRARGEPEPTDGLEPAAEEEVDDNSKEDAGDENDVESHGYGDGTQTMVPMGYWCVYVDRQLRTATKSLWKG
ncbi:hypothetical protein GW17_00046560, partial [Ensete ventricosum]